jgi:hypothetical protein
VYLTERILFSQFILLKKKEKKMKHLQQWTKEFYSINPNGTKDELAKFIREKENEVVEQKFEQYKQRDLKNVSDNYIDNDNY